MPRDTVRYGIVGCAGIASKHAEAVKAATGADLVACTDIVEEHSRNFAEEYNLTWYTDITRMVADADLDAVSVCTPSGTHAEIVEAIADAGAHVLCEKPLDIELAKVDRMVNACENANVHLSCVFQRRFHPAARRAKDAIETNELGRITLGDVYCKWYRSQDYYDQAEWRGTPEMDGGVLMNQAIHGIDMVQWLLGDIERVNAKCGTLGRDIDVEDTAVVNVEFENGAFGSIEATTAVYPEKPLTVEALGEKGSFILDIDNNELRDFETVDGVVDFEDDEPVFGHGRQVQDFVDAIREGRKPAVDAEEARRVVEVILAIYESSRRNEPVRMDEFRERRLRSQTRV